MFLVRAPKRCIAVASEWIGRPPLSIRTSDRLQSYSWCTLAIASLRVSPCPGHCSTYTCKAGSDTINALNAGLCSLFCCLKYCLAVPTLQRGDTSFRTCSNMRQTASFANPRRRSIGDTSATAMPYFKFFDSSWNFISSSHVTLNDIVYFKAPTRLPA